VIKYSIRSEISNIRIRTAPVYRNVLNDAIKNIIRFKIRTYMQLAKIKESLGAEMI